MLVNKKTFALTAVHPAYACEATTAIKRACEIPSSGTGAMEEQAGPTSYIANVWVT